MTGYTARSLFSPTTWRRFWTRLGELEEALATTEGDIIDRRLSRIEAEIAELRAHAGLPRHIASEPMSTVSSSRS
ncbi:hypothetical protein MKK58_26580 [Methylobacterium sp. J-078]|jgi:hypothetical protein|uniref:hypothetical protein n=1 Tax=unclassified Methylobacterium TaxID=2615210 RepID=UPI0006F541F0|nr:MULTISPECIES: hypothetical protein [unclassified Methylobacterium]KQO56556.1 hypothetical protein ASF24_18845 [Methylobacterium sp. Leaf86]MCJ2048077.1 hypothetical protein [Methylobacterium sp. J-078]